ncbi:MAG: helix-hairpin-helix domain-containing protein [Cyanobacteria bacterium P01_D01_bin.36]
MPHSDLDLTQKPRVTYKAFLLAFIPILGGLSIVKESDRLRDRTTTHLAWAAFALSLVTALSGHFLTAWLVQIALAIWLKAKHTGPFNAGLSHAGPSSTSIAPSIQQVDLNTCSKNDLVRVLNLPIVYANDIDLIRAEGYLFTYAEELTAIAGIPEAHVRRIAPQLIFAYHAQIEENHTWRQLNVLTVGEMLARGVEGAIAQKIVEERTSNGDYRSAVDVKRRTGLPFRTYENLV